MTAMVIHRLRCPNNIGRDTNTLNVQMQGPEKHRFGHHSIEVLDGPCSRLSPEWTWGQHITCSQLSPTSQENLVVGSGKS